VKYRCFIKAQFASTTPFPAEDLTNCPLVLRRDAMEELLHGYVQVRSIQRPRPGPDRFLQHSLANFLVYLDIKKLLFPPVAIFRRCVA
jgi:hypothetical protein